MYSTLYPFETISPRTSTNADSFFLLSPRSQIISLLFLLDCFMLIALPPPPPPALSSSPSSSPAPLLAVALEPSLAEDAVRAASVDEDIKKDNRLRCLIRLE